MNSAFQPKRVSKSHITEKRFVAYSKANNYIKHLVNFYEQKKDNLIYDESSILHQIFKEQTPVNSVHKLSLMPKSSMASEIEEKIKRLNAFHNISDMKIKKSLLKEKQSISSSKRFKDSYFNTKKYSSLLNKLCNFSHPNEDHEQDTFITNDTKYVKKFSDLMNEKRRARSQNKVVNVPKCEIEFSPPLVKDKTPRLGFLDFNQEISLPQYPGSCATTRFPRLKILKSKKKGESSVRNNKFLEKNSLDSPTMSKYTTNGYPEYLIPNYKDAEVNT